jgi:hypothetical protein
MKDLQLNLQEIPSLSQRQDSITDQLLDLKCVAQRLGMYDAADFIQRHLESCIPQPHQFVPRARSVCCGRCSKPKSHPIHQL